MAFDDKLSSTMKRDRWPTVTVRLPPKTHRLLKIRASVADVPVRQVLLCGALAFIRGELRVAPDGSYTIGKADTVGLDEVPTREDVRREAGAEGTAGMRVSWWDHRTDDRGVPLRSVKHIHALLEDHLGRPVSVQNVKRALAYLFPKPARGLRWEWPADSREWEHVHRVLTTGGWERAMRAYIDAFRENRDLKKELAEAQRRKPHIDDLRRRKAAQEGEDLRQVS